MLKEVIDIAKEAGEINMCHYGNYNYSNKIDGSPVTIADIYPRLNGTKEWDTTSSEVILFEAGCSMVTYPERK